MLLLMTMKVKVLRKKIWMLGGIGGDGGGGDDDDDNEVDMSFDDDDDDDADKHSKSNTDGLIGSLLQPSRFSSSR